MLKNNMIVSSLKSLQVNLNYVSLSYEDRRSNSILPGYMQQRNAYRTDRRHDKPSASSSAQGWAAGDFQAGLCSDHAISGCLL